MEKEISEKKIFEVLKIGRTNREERKPGRMMGPKL